MALWDAWQEQHHQSVLITGLSGVGKTEQLLWPLVLYAQQSNLPAIRLEVPANPLSADGELRAQLIEELKDVGLTELAQDCENAPNFTDAAKCVLKAGGLVAIDEFQRLLEPNTGQPLPAWNKPLQKLVRRNLDHGCLWLVSNREPAAEWVQSLPHTCPLSAPDDIQDQISIVLEHLGSNDVDNRFPKKRRTEVVRRLGGNPRALRLLGTLLKTHALTDLLGPEQATPDAPDDPVLVEKLEKEMIQRAAGGLSSQAHSMLEMLTVLPDPATWTLVETTSGHSATAARHAATELQNRYLLDARGSRYLVHPVAREVLGPQLRRKPEDWKQANLRAGQWHAQGMQTAINRSSKDAELALRLSGVRYHFGQAGAQQELIEALKPARTYIERTFNDSTPTPGTDTELNGLIELLSAFLQEPAAWGIEFLYARLLWSRNQPGDAVSALPHAKRAALKRDDSIPWVLWIKLVREAQGLDAAVQTAKQGIAAVKPEKGLYSVYQILGACLADSGRTQEAIDALLEGVNLCTGQSYVQRLYEGAICYAAAEPDSHLLQRVRLHIAARGDNHPRQLALADVLLQEQCGDWEQAASLAAQAQRKHPDYLHLCHHAALASLALGQTTEAEAAIALYPKPFQQETRNGNQWLLSLAALQTGDLAKAQEHYRIYSGEDHVPATLHALKTELLRQWDTRTLTIGEANPALIAPILPKAITGLPADMRRPQYGSPVLPPSVYGETVLPAENTAKRLKILAIATEWQSGKGGLSTLNRNLCLALARAGADVICIVEPGVQPATPEDGGVRIIAAPSTPGTSAHDALMRKPVLPADFSPDIIIGHSRVTGPAAKALAEDHFPQAQRWHVVHMAPDEIEWLKSDRQDDAGLRAEDRTATELRLAQGASRVIAIGPRLYERYLRDLEAEGLADPIRLDPGFDYETQPRQPPRGEPWAVLVMGRMEDAELKGLDIASKAIGKMAQSTGQPASLELIVRGTPAGESPATKKQVEDWANSPKLMVTPRPYTTDTTKLDADLRKSSLVLMPSRAEGFGLVGLEAILAGTPVLISAESGLGQLLEEVLPAESAKRHVVPVTGDLDQDADTWSREVQAVLRDRDAAFARAEELRQKLATQCSWEQAVSQLLD